MATSSGQGGVPPGVNNVPGPKGDSAFDVAVANGFVGTEAEWLASLEADDLDVLSVDVFEYRDIWAEEGSGTDPNSAEWSFGNGSVGFMGLPIDAGWEVQAMYFQADTYPATATIQVDLVNYGNTPSDAAANTIAAISLASAVDGGGQVDNAYKYQVFAAPVAIPVVGDATVIGFLTRGETGAISDARVGARLRRKVGEFLTNAVAE